MFGAGAVSLLDGWWCHVDWYGEGGVLRGGCVDRSEI